jgi:carboxymethylenebutenolidase
MNHIQRYLVDEVVVDYAAGIVDRREALRQLGLLGVAAASALGLLAACDAEGGGQPPPASSATTAPATPGATGPAGPTPTATAAITFPAADGRTVQGAYASPSAPRANVLVVHENRGLTDHIRSVAGRLATTGYAALAVDLLSAEGGTATFSDPARATAALNVAPLERFVADMRAAITELLRRNPTLKVGAVGFCFGGGMMWSLLAAGEPRLGAVAPFYGPLPDGADFAGSANAAVLGVYAEFDGRVNASRGAAEAALKAANLTHEIVTYPGVDHGFFNDTGSRYNAAAAVAVYQKLTSWFDEYLA